MKTALVTGATGFVGANLARKLIKDGHQVHLLLRPNYSPWRIEEIRSDCSLHEVDFENFDALAKTVLQIKPDWIFHLAANGAYSWQTDVDEIMRTNLLGTINLVRACAESGFDAFINTGSSSEYGFKDHAPIEDEAVEPNSYYAVAKVSATLFCGHFARTHKLKIPTLRLYSVYGPYEDANRLMPRVIVYGLRGELPPLVDPSVARDYVSADDVCLAYLEAANKPIEDLGAVFNVGAGVQTNLAEVVEVAKRVLKIETEPKWGSMPNRSWDTSVWVSNSTKISRDLGWRAQDDFESGFKKMVCWFQDNDAQRKAYEARMMQA